MENGNLGPAIHCSLTVSNISTILEISSEASDNEVKKAQQLIENSETEKNQLRVTVENGAEKIPDLLKNLSKNKLEAVSVTANKPSLDDVFLEVTGYRLEGATEEEGLKEEVSENE